MSENTTPEQPGSPALRSLHDFLDGRHLLTWDLSSPRFPEPVRLYWRASGQDDSYTPLTEAETSTVLALFALVALEWVARDECEPGHRHEWFTSGRPGRVVCGRCGAVRA